MKIHIYLIILILSYQNVFSQNNVKMFTEFGSKNNEINSLMLFENIGVEKVSFEGSELIGKYYEINLKEYKKGKLTNTKKLFDIEGVDFLKIDSIYTSFKFFEKIKDNKITIFIESPRMYGEKSTFKIEKGKEQDYILKDFQGTKKFIYVPTNEEYPILAIITPTKQKDGSSSYCEVAQSEVSPEKFWEKFEIPHYFVITIKFK